jgi:hypothetical protein
MQVVGRIMVAIECKENKTSLSLKLNTSLNGFIIMNLGQSVITHSHPFSTK